MSEPRRALLLIAHGSRKAEANADLDYIADGVRARGIFSFVKTAYLELAQPSIPDAAMACVKAGATEVVMMPYFLSGGVHVSDDLEQSRIEFAIQFPDVEFRLAEPLGRHPLLIDIVCERATTR